MLLLLIYLVSVLGGFLKEISGEERKGRYVLMLFCIGRGCGGMFYMSFDVPRDGDHSRARYDTLSLMACLMS